MLDHWHPPVKDWEEAARGPHTDDRSSEIAGLKDSDELANVWALAAPFFDTKSRVLLRPLGDVHDGAEHALGKRAWALERQSLLSAPIGCGCKAYCQYKRYQLHDILGSTIVSPIEFTHMLIETSMKVPLSYITKTGPIRAARMCLVAAHASASKSRDLCASDRTRGAL
ncbi:hypothetical protein M728_001730 [Ensifer sp. WSM1721]